MSTKGWMRVLISLLLVISGSLQAAEQPATDEQTETAVATKHVRICYQAQPLPPFTQLPGESAQEHSGFAIDSIAKAVQLAGFVPEYYRSSWNRCVEDLKEGRTDSLIALTWTPERDTWAQFPQDSHGQLREELHLWQSDYRIFVAKGSALKWDGKTLSQLTYGIGAPIGHLTHQRLQALHSIEPVTVSNDKGLRLVDKGHLDGQIVDATIGQALLKQMGLEDAVIPLPIPFYKEPWYLPFSHASYQQNPERAERIWQAVKTVREEQGAAIIERYLQPVEQSGAE